MRRALTLLIAAVCAASCLPRERLNADCRWTDDPGASLADDIEVAEETGIRYGDSFRRREGLAVEGRRRHECTAALLDKVAERHRLTADQLAQARHVRRHPYFDALAVFTPIAIAVLALGWAVARMIRARFGDEPRPRVLATVAASVVCTAMVYQAGAIWSFLTEQWRLRSHHLGYRAFDLPWSRHAPIAIVGCFALFWATALLQYHRRHHA